MTKSYRLIVERTIKLMEPVYIEGDSEIDAFNKFNQQYKARSCPEIEDKNAWTDSFGQYLKNCDPYADDYEVVHITEET